jgi:hypothetical protein
MAPVPNCCIGAIVAPAALEELVEDAEAPEAAAEVGVDAAEEEEVVVELSVMLGGVRCPQLAASFLEQRA